MKFNDQGLELIKSFEGCKLKVYKDIIGLLTVGFGHRTALAEGTEITQEEADQLLEKDLQKFIDGVTNLLEVELPDNCFSALVCFSYNCGLENLAKSTLLKKTNAADIQGAGDEFLKWNRAGGQIVAGLTRRREAERDLFLSA